MREEQRLEEQRREEQRREERMLEAQRREAAHQQLLYFCRGNYLNKLQQAVANGANLLYKFGEGGAHNALHAACEGTEPSRAVLVHWIATHGEGPPTLDTPNAQGRTALTIASHFCNVEVVKVLLSLGAVVAQRCCCRSCRPAVTTEVTDLLQDGVFYWSFFFFFFFARCR